MSLKTENPRPQPQPEALMTKIIHYVACQAAKGSTWCQQCCDDCFTPETEKRRRISKSDIQPVIQHQPVSKMASDASQGSHGSLSWVSQCSVHSPASFRDRNDSETSGSSRKGSSSSISMELRRSNPTPIIEMKPIEFWAANRETVQPRTPRRRLPSESEISVEDLKPDLYESPAESSDECLTDEQKLARFQLGQIHFSLQYDIACESLVVKVLEARDLPLPYCQDTSKQDMARSNPYAKVCLLPDIKDYQQTTVQRKTQDPVWGEAFTFRLPFVQVQRRTLEITVKDFDKYSRHCVIGQMHMALEEINTVKGGHMWKPLLPSTKELPDLGEILLSLNYLPSAGRLNVDIIKAKQLLQTDLIGGSDPVVKVALCQGDKSIKTKRTSIKKNTIDPVFNESFSFNLAPGQLASCSLVVTVWDHNSKSKDDFVGRIIMGKQATGPYEVSHWNRMLHCQRSPVAEWHTLRPRNECDQKCALSATVM